MSLRATTITLLMTFFLAGCGKDSGQPSPIQTDVPFTPEGILDFVRPDSSIINRIVIEIAETPQEQAQGFDVSPLPSPTAVECCLLIRLSLCDPSG